MKKLSLKFNFLFYFFPLFLSLSLHERQKIFILESLRGIIGYLLEHPNYNAKVRTLGIPIAPGVRRFFRFIGLLLTKKKYIIL